MNTTVPLPWRGSVLARALWLDRRGRVLELWQPGANVHELANGWLLRLPKPQRWRAESAPGLVLVERDGALTAVQREATRSGEVLLPVAGQVFRSQLADLPAIDACAWVDVRAYRVAAVQPLGAPPAPVASVPQVDLRNVLGRGPESAENKRLQAALHTPGTPPFWQRWVAQMLQALAPTTEKPARTQANLPPGRAEPPAERAQWLQKLLAPLWQLTLGKLHGQHLARMVALFEEGRLQEFLRTAVPLAQPGTTAAGLAWNLPSPRTNLQLRMNQGASPTIGVAGHVLGHLREMYEQALRRLLQQGKLDDAVFVLVELLGEHGRAIDLLEKQGNFRLAAQVAEASKLSPDIAVQLWVRAGDLERSVLLARRSGAFAAAVKALAKADAALAAELRLAWARHLAAAGDAAGACTVAWVDPQLRTHALPWLEAAIAAGTPAGAALVGHLPMDTDEACAVVRRHCSALQVGAGQEAARMRLALAGGLTAAGPRGRLLARPVLRQLLQDYEQVAGTIDPGKLRTLLQLADEPAFVADLPPLLQAVASLRRRKQPLLVAFAAGDVGAVAVHDLAFLAGGGLLVALGSLGMASYARDGRLRARFAEPATDLVPVAGTARAIAVMRRPWGLRLCRVDLAANTAQPWHDAAYHTWEPTSDGNAWFVAEGDSVLALDPTAADPRSLWRVNQLGGKPAYLRRSDTQWSVSVDDGMARETFVYSCPHWVLRSRRRTWGLAEGPPLGPGSIAETLAADGSVVRLQLTESVPTVWQQRPDQSVTDAPMVGLSGVGHTLDAFEMCGDWLAAVCRGKSGAVVGLWYERVLVLQVDLAGSAAARIRLSEEQLCIGDDLGRALVFELEGGTLLRDVRVG